MRKYGDEPIGIRPLDLTADWHELMHYLYLPVRMPQHEEHGSPPVRLPERLEFLRPAVVEAMHNARHTHPDPYVYVTARHGYATPDNPLNRPGFHCDGFGTDDLNYVWWDRWPSRFLIGDLPYIETSHVESMRQFDKFAAWSVEPCIHRAQPGWCLPCRDLDVHTPYRIAEPDDDGVLQRLTPYVIHATPLIPEPGGMRRFLKVSVSNHRYNLRGNSHNYRFAYAWTMYPRNDARNDPVYGEADFRPEES